MELLISFKGLFFRSHPIGAEEFSMADTALNTASTDPVTTVGIGERAITISDSAAKRVLVLRELEGDDSLMLRITVSGGGCSGFQYGFASTTRRTRTTTSSSIWESRWSPTTRRLTC